ncbi:MAG TPA: methylenetetrahydrofolate--tRNA-(uracil(54)-C(5))-methyltransferase (FADH(2)-oxidizing) TrmFO [Candidatus Sulfotelmatobacter sp.]|nr:methylenetetrahydrofolate--tRNA-(uracil(54)-C(5))-methyltransferase (FADH(2)-oxidizing) TrmFO [Candidatus Sulfotelmatobacter sp.]
MTDSCLTVLGGGLAGCEAAWHAAERGIAVRLLEMRPAVPTPTHRTDRLAELVCSNSLKSESLQDASGLLKAEMRRLGSLVLRCAEAHRVPAGSALAVDRDAFATAVTAAIETHRCIQVVRMEAQSLPLDRPLVVATGPLTSDKLAADLAQRFAAFLGAGEAAPGAAGALPPLLHFYDAISPIVAADSIDPGVAFAAARYGKGGADYLNCPMTCEEYGAFRQALLSGEQYPLHDFETPHYFEGCLPIEELAARGEDTLRFGPMRPVGLRDPRTGHRPYAVVQLRWENQGPDGQPTMYNLVGFQTRLRRGPQAAALRLIPGLARAEILRYGSIHRNTFIAAPALLRPSLQLRAEPDILVAGQLTGVEGYLESAATGLLAGLNAARLARGESPLVPPRASVLGSLLAYLTTADVRAFQPINANLGLLPPAPRRVRDREERNQLLAARAQAEFQAWIDGGLGGPARDDGFA